MSVATASRSPLLVLSSGANAMATPVSAAPTRLVSWRAAASTTPRVWTASVVCPSSRTVRGPVAPQKTPTSVYVSVPRAAVILAGKQSQTSQWGLLLGGPGMRCGVLSSEGELKETEGSINPPSQAVPPGQVHPGRRLWSEGRKVPKPDLTLCFNCSNPGS